MLGLGLLLGLALDLELVQEQGLGLASNRGCDGGQRISPVLLSPPRLGLVLGLVLVLVLG